MTDRDSIIEQIDWRLDHTTSAAFGAAVSAEAYNPDPTPKWQAFADELRELADLADQLTRTA